MSSWVDCDAWYLQSIATGNLEEDWGRVARFWVGYDALCAELLCCELVQRSGPYQAWNEQIGAIPRLDLSLFRYHGDDSAGWVQEELGSTANWAKDRRWVRVTLGLRQTGMGHSILEQGIMSACYTFRHTLACLQLRGKHRTQLASQYLPLDLFTYADDSEERDVA